MTDDIELLEYKVDEQEKELGQLKAELADLQKKIADRDIARQAEERQRLMWGIKALGSLVIVLFGVLWAYRAVIMGDPPKFPHK